MTGGNNFETTVFPFILRGASIIGIDSVFTPIKLRKRVWRRLAKDLKPQQLHDIKHVISFDEIPKQSIKSSIIIILDVLSLISMFK